MAKVQDGNAVYVTAPADVTKNSVLVADGWAGIVMNDADSGDTVALAIDGGVYEISVGELTAGIGDILYITAAGELSTTNTDFVFAKVVQAKDSNGYAWVKLLEVRDEIA